MMLENRDACPEHRPTFSMRGLAGTPLFIETLEKEHVI
jgi:hypothetical protein